MYDLYTICVVFMLLCPGVIVPQLPGSPLYSAILHAIVFYFVLSWLSNFVSWWLVWLIAGFVVVGRLWMASRLQ
jgi:hypothetical protein